MQARHLIRNIDAHLSASALDAEDAAFGLSELPKEGFHERRAVCERIIAAVAELRQAREIVQGWRLQTEKLDAEPAAPTRNADEIAATVERMKSAHPAR